MNEAVINILVPNYTFLFDIYLGMDMLGFFVCLFGWFLGVFLAALHSLWDFGSPTRELNVGSQQ